MKGCGKNSNHRVPIARLGVSIANVSSLGQVTWSMLQTTQIFTSAEIRNTSLATVWVRLQCSMYTNEHRPPPLWSRCWTSDELLYLPNEISRVLKLKRNELHCENKLFILAFNTREWTMGVITGQWTAMYHQWRTEDLGLELLTVSGWQRPNPFEPHCFRWHHGSGYPVNSNTLKERTNRSLLGRWRVYTQNQAPFTDDCRDTIYSCFSSAPTPGIRTSASFLGLFRLRHKNNHWWVI